MSMYELSNKYLTKVPEMHILKGQPIRKNAKKE